MLMLNDMLITDGTGMTGVVNKFQRRMPSTLRFYHYSRENLSCSISHMEHHSNQTSWLETIVYVVVIPYRGWFVYIENLQLLLKEYENRPFKIASITSVQTTGIRTPYHE
jgi:selenocysteine lyase/cysteine desulfurase